MAAHHVTIGPEFFAKSRNDYDDWRWALVREFFQNSIDCGSNRIRLDVHLNECGNTVVTVTNDGRSMTRDIIVNKLFSLGASGKNFAGTTGGFGKAKELLYFCHLGYEIRSGDCVVSGAGAAYDIAHVEQTHAGTCSTIVIEGDHVLPIVNNAERFVTYAQVDPVFTILGNDYKADLKKGAYRRDLGFGKVYTNKTFPNRLIVRINGIPMFTYYAGLERTVILELTGSSDKVLTSNRDGLVQPFKAQLSDFITELAVDRRSALRNKSVAPRYIHYSGAKLAHHNRLDVAAVIKAFKDIRSDCSKRTEATAGVQNVAEDRAVHAYGKGLNVQMSVETTDRWGSSAPSFTDGASVQRTVTLGTDFIMKNETGLKIPSHFDPGSLNFGSYATRLVRSWGRLILEMHRLFNHEAAFSVGFIFDEGDVGSTEAQFETGDFGKVYYVNPAIVAEQSRSNSRSFKKRFRLTERDRLITVAAHEFVHGLGYGWHDERYANMLTTVMSKVMKHRKRFNWCFT